MITLKRLKILNIISWIPIVNLVCFGCFVWEILSRTGVFTDKEIQRSSTRTIMFQIVYLILRHLFLFDLYEFITNGNVLLFCLIEAWLATIVPIRYYYLDVKKAYERQVAKQVVMTTCPNCNYEQPVTRTVCWNCGAEMSREADLNPKSIENSEEKSNGQSKDKTM